MISSCIRFNFDALSICASPIGITSGEKIEIVKVNKENYDNIMKFINKNIDELSNILFFPLFCYIDNKKKEMKIICKTKNIEHKILLEKLNPNIIPSIKLGCKYLDNYKKDVNWGFLLERLPILFLNNEDEIRECYEHLPISEKSFKELFKEFFKEKKFLE